jgi:hypothetical protein
VSLEVRIGALALAVSLHGDAKVLGGPRRGGWRHSYAPPPPPLCIFCMEKH